MAGLDKIIGEIGSSSDALVKDLIAKAEAEAKKITDQAEQEAEESASRIRRETETRLTDTKNRAQSAAALAKRQMLLEEKQNLIGETIGKAKQKFLEMPDAQYFDAVVKLVKKNALPKDGVILFNERDRKRLPSNFAETLNKTAKEAGGSLKISDLTRAIDGGFVLAYDGMEQNCSVSALFEQDTEMLQDRIQSLLFSAQ